MLRRLRLPLFVLVAWALAVAVLVGAVAHVGNYSSELETNSATHTVSSVNATGADFIAVAVSWRDSGQTISSVTHGGTSLTAAAAKVASAQGEACQLWYAVAPSGTQTVTVTFSGTTGGNSQVGVLLLSGVDQASPIGTVVTASSGAGGTSTTTSAATSAVGGMVIDCLAIRGGTPDPAPGGGATEYHQQAADFSVTGAASYVAGAASVTMSWSWSGGQPWSHMVVPVNAAAGGGGVVAPASLTTLGVGQ